MLVRPGKTILLKRGNVSHRVLSGLCTRTDVTLMATLTILSNIQRALRRLNVIYTRRTALGNTKLVIHRRRNISQKRIRSTKERLLFRLNKRKSLVVYYYGIKDEMVAALDRTNVHLYIDKSTQFLNLKAQECIKQIYIRVYPTGYMSPLQKLWPIIHHMNWPNVGWLLTHVFEELL